MDAAAFDRSVIDHAAALFLRYFSAAQRLSIDQPSLVMKRDRDLLRLHWSLSSPVTALVSYVLANRHEVQSVLGSEVRIEDGVLRGRLDSVKTVMLRRISGLETAIVGKEPVRSYRSGANQVLGWVLMEAWALASRFSAVTLESAGYRERIDQAHKGLDQCRRLQSIAHIVDGKILHKRPTAAAIREASRSRRRLYHMATEAYRYLLKIESGDGATIAVMLRETMLGPLEPWRRFELAVGLSVAEALAAAQNKPLALSLLVGDTKRYLARVGDFGIYWQHRTEFYVSPEPEPSEQRERHILTAYGISNAGDRPDLVIVDHARNAVTAVIEVKYLTGEDATERVKGAVGQIVRYARGYAQSHGLDRLIGRSLAVISQGIKGLTLAGLPSDVPRVVDFAGIKQDALVPWATSLCDVAAQPA
jgi:hypothetical protein